MQPERIIDWQRHEWQRLPGLFRQRELHEVFADHNKYYHEPAGQHSDRSELFAVYIRAEAITEIDNALLGQKPCGRVPRDTTCPRCCASAHEIEALAGSASGRLSVICMVCNHEWEVAQ